MCPVLPDGSDAGRKATREVIAISATQAHAASARHQLGQRAAGQHPPGQPDFLPGPAEAFSLPLAADKFYHGTSASTQGCAHTARTLRRSKMRHAISLARRLQAIAYSTWRAEDAAFGHRTCESAFYGKWKCRLLVWWAAQIGLALQHCHLHGVLHRDVKPENCFFRSTGGDLLLGDFGISCALDEQKFAKTCCGSPLNLSPEIVNQEPYSYASDVWSFGVTIYEAAMLAPPFRGSNICQVAFRIVSCTPEPLPSASLQGLVEGLLVKDPTQRSTLRSALTSPPLVGAVQLLTGPLPAQMEHASGFVHRLRHTTRSEEEYPDDFEDGSVESDGENLEISDGSYELDFEDPSEDEVRPPELSEEQLRKQICAELGVEAMALADSLGVVSFLESMMKR
ncbi:unnamed protein product [Cladocopium goreaui]|uniref:non-specific serine/threonine protein kinase n=1 Tax=Cladocopium goreaui TaxID=2562237 RepID=A0A9P1M2X3_9DINO|nr:unnamed protein product [Cladocopium goreaui]